VAQQTRLCRSDLICTAADPSASQQSGLTTQRPVPLPLGLRRPVSVAWPATGQLTVHLHHRGLGGGTASGDLQPLTGTGDSAAHSLLCRLSAARPLNPTIPSPLPDAPSAPPRCSSFDTPCCTPTPTPAPSPFPPSPPPPPPPCRRRTSSMPASASRACPTGTARGRTTCSSATQTTVRPCICQYSGARVFPWHRVLSQSIRLPHAYLV